MGERGDKLKTMHRVMREAELERPAGDYAIFNGASREAPVIGRVVGVGLAEELGERHYLVVDGIDGRVHYAEMAKLPAGQLPETGMIVALTGSSGNKGRQRNAQVEILSHWELERLPDAEARTWLDQTIAAGKEPVIRDTSFGRQVMDALHARRQWLVDQGLAVETPSGAIVPRRGMLQTLVDRELSRIEQRITAETGVLAIREFDMTTVQGKLLRTINQPSMQLAAVKTRAEIVIVPWGATLDRIRGRQMGGRDLARALTRGKDLGLSR